MTHRLVTRIGSMNSDQENLFSSPPLHVLLPGYGREVLNRFQEDHLVLPAGLPLEPIRRLLVLIPENDFDENKLSQSIWNLAAPGALAVSIVALSSLPSAENFLRRRLATIATNTRDSSVRVSTKILPGNNWIQAVKDILQPGDLVICLENHVIINWGVIRRPVGIEISSSLNIPVYMITGFRLGPTVYRSWVKEAATWLVAFGIIGLFTWLQILIDQAIQGWQSDLILIITVIFEALLIWKLHEISS